MYTSNSFLFFSIYGFILLVSFLKAYLFYIVVKLMHKLDLTQPLNSFTANQITQMSYFTLIIGFVSYVAKEFVNNIGKNGVHFGDLNHFWADSQAFIIMGAVIYIIATIFKKGVEIQNENELTV